MQRTRRSKLNSRQRGPGARSVCRRHEHRRSGVWRVGAGNGV